ncbi:helix-turn-helix domain-containing protein [Pseudomonas sp. S31]|uniref:helix-turn-helix domain-containing protein n=1 Tax=Pseudomonas sp. S31 TaxID=1564473 RepID=UPI001913F021|nr:XRE family transcriptional regulator [Pseudomonas sp. S31]MBK5000216.1 helix-turn-helix domain-containing protein [Pseudomonas sp. S31]
MEQTVAAPGAQAKTEGPESTADIAKKIAELRRDRQWTLKDAAQATGVASSTLSKIERQELSPTISTLQKIASGFGLDVIQLLSNQEQPQKLAGRRSITRAGQGSVHPTKTCINEVLCHDLKHKRMTPLYTTIGARSIDDYSSWPKSDAEIFLYVIKGTLVVNSRLYEPIELHEGDSMYYDASTEHLWTSKGAEDAQILWMISNN